MSPEEIESLLESATPEQRVAMLRLLRERYRIPLHPLETQWNTTAEAILEAIASAGDLTQRGIRGVLAEAIFRTTVLPKSLPSWREQPIEGDQPFDLLLDDGNGPVRVQVKLQRRERGQVKYYRKDTDHFVVETQRTRGGKRPDNELSRPYRVSEFDVLAVCLHPATGDWTSFLYCACRDLKVRATNPEFLEVLQPVPVKGSATWSRDFSHVVARVRSAR